MNIIEYVKQNQKSFKEDSLKETDFAVFSQISYFEFQKFFKKQDVVTFKQFNLLKDKQYLVKKALDSKKGLKLVNELVVSNRFKDIEIFHFKKYTSSSKKIQFAALSFKIDFNTYVICYRGTDISLTGWYESTMLSYKTTIPGQLSAKHYLDELVAIFPSNTRFYLTGHSKGGNLAQYAYLFAKKESQDQVEAIYNFEGPGNLENYPLEDKNASLLSKIKKYITKDSVIGTLLLDNINSVIIDATGINGVIQHAIYEWKIDEKTQLFKRIPSLSKTSLALSASFTSWLKCYSTRKKRQLLNQLFSFLKECGIQTQKDFNLQFISKGRKLLSKRMKNSKSKEFFAAVSNFIKIFLNYRFMPTSKLLEIYKQKNNSYQVH